jgi:hypothetical protein
MMKKTGIKSMAVLSLFFLLALLICCSRQGEVEEFQSSWVETFDRIWVGPEYWANRLQDWRIANGRLECVEKASNKPMRTVHLLTRRLSEDGGRLNMSVQTGLIEETEKIAPDAKTGFLLGAGKGLDYRTAALIHHSHGPGAGLFVGMDGKGCLFIHDFETDELIVEEMGSGVFKPVKLELKASPNGEMYSLDMSGSDPETGETLCSLTLNGVDSSRLAGNLALVSHPGSDERGHTFWFNAWKISGDKVEQFEDHLCGPVLSAQHTLSRDILKLTAQLMPVGEENAQTAALEIQQAGKWKRIATEKIRVPGHTATFRIKDWDSSRDWPFRVVCKLTMKKGRDETYFYPGTVRRDPEEKETIVVAAFTGNHNLGRGWGGADSGHFSWTESVWFPHDDLTERVAKHRPDVLFFSGDQVYEGASPTRAQKSPDDKASLDYLYKWYLWCWAFRDLARDIPCITIPDDHDVYQGNIWGAGGRKVDRDNRGGYVMPSEWVNMVQRTQTNNLPDPFDPTPIEQGITVYYTDMNYGRISFAVIEDRKFKSGCAGLVPPTNSGRPDHVIDPDFDPRTADVHGAKLLGERQIQFLENWGADWKNTDMKVVLSQTVFSNASSLHGAGQMRLVADYDSNGWPQTGRNRALRKFRKAFATHISGDQHLATIIQYGVDEWNDAGWSFCVPSIANFYPRSWIPLESGKNRREGMPGYTGEFLDGLGNRITVWAVANPGESTGREPVDLHDKMPGYGIIKLNKKEQTITFECWPRYADPETDDQYPGWPKTIHMEDNYGRESVACLPIFAVSGLSNPVFQVIDEASGEIVYTLRIKGTSFRPKVFREGMYTVKIGEPGTHNMKTIRGVNSLQLDKQLLVDVKF